MLAVAIASIAVGAVSTAGVILFILKLSYFPMAVCLLLAAHGFYATPFYFREYSDLFRTELIQSARDSGCTDIRQLASAAAVSEEYAAKLIAKADKIIDKKTV